MWRESGREIEIKGGPRKKSVTDDKREIERARERERE